MGGAMSMTKVSSHCCGLHIGCSLKSKVNQSTRQVEEDTWFLNSQIYNSTEAERLPRWLLYCNWWVWRLSHLLPSPVTWWGSFIITGESKGKFNPLRGDEFKANTIYICIYNASAATAFTNSNRTLQISLFQIWHQINFRTKVIHWGDG